MSEQDLRWPGGKRIAVLFNLCLEQWSDGKAPGISPMGNPLPPGVLDMTAISWAAFGCRRGRSLRCRGNRSRPRLARLRGGWWRLSAGR